MSIRDVKNWDWETLLSADFLGFIFIMLFAGILTLAMIGTVYDLKHKIVTSTVTTHTNITPLQSLSLSSKVSGSLEGQSYFLGGGYVSGSLTQVKSWVYCVNTTQGSQIRELPNDSTVYIKEEPNCKNPRLETKSTKTITYTNYRFILSNDTNDSNVVNSQTFYIPAGSMVTDYKVIVK
jgi:hypothetical protein